MVVFRYWPLFHRWIGAGIFVSACLLQSVEGRLLDTRTANETQEPTRNTTTIGAQSSSLDQSHSTIWRFPLHQASGTQHVNLYIGQPPTRQTWILDTGSRFSATLCGAYCPGCTATTSSKTATTTTTRRRINPNPAYPGSFTNKMVPCGECQMKSTCEGFPTRDEGKAMLSSAFSSAMNGRSQSSSTTAMDASYCRLNQRYTEGSRWTAWEVNDIVAMEGAERVSGENSQERDDKDIAWDMAVPLAFGCQTDIRGLFRQQYANGILGLQPSNYSIPSIWYQQGLIPQNGSFRLCLHPTGGWFMVGHGPHHVTLTRPPHTPLRYTPSAAAALGPETTNRNQKLWYGVLVESVWMGNRLLADIGSSATSDIIQAFRHGKATLLDSGTTDTFLPAALEPIFSQAWQQVTGIPYSHQRQDYTWLQFQTLPDISLILEGNVTWTLRPQYYMEGVPLRSIPNDDDNSTRTDDTGVVVEPWSGTKPLINRLYVDEPMGAVLGLNAMMGYEIDFHIPTRTIGMAPANCHV